MNNPLKKQGHGLPKSYSIVSTLFILMTLGGALLLAGCNPPPPTAVSDAIQNPIEGAEDISLPSIEQSLRLGSQTYMMAQGKPATGFTDYVAQSPQTVEEGGTPDQYTVFMESVAHGSDRSKPCSIQPEVIRCPMRTQIAIFHWQEGKITSEALPKDQ